MTIKNHPEKEAGVSMDELFDTFSIDDLNTDNITLNPNKLATPLQSILEQLHDAADYVQHQIKFITTATEPMDKSIPQNCAAELCTRLFQIENLLHSYLDHARINIYDIFNYMESNKYINSNSVQIQKSDNVITIYLPCLPARNKGSNALVNQMLASKIFSAEPFPKWNQWTATFIHVYPNDACNIPKDVDNFDYKKTIDLIAYALGSSDNCLHFDMHTTCVFSDKLTAGVYIEIREKSLKNQKLPEWEI